MCQGQLADVRISKYYAENCFKGGVGTQLCGWILTAPLWTGAVSDTDYNRRAFTNIYDKGYRAKQVAWRLGKQRVLQPVWADSDRRFGRDDTLLTASVATDRGANERAFDLPIIPDARCRRHHEAH